MGEGKVILMPDLQREADRLLSRPDLCAATKRAIRRDLHMEPPEPEQPELPLAQAGALDGGGND
jgi:hypothetical protein